MKKNERFLHIGHFAFMRGLIQGLDLMAMWNRYLYIEGESTDARVVRRTIHWIRLELDTAARRAGKPGTARLLRLQVRSMAEDKAVPQQSLQEFAEEHGLESFSEAEVIEAWSQAHPGQSREQAGAERLMRKQLQALSLLERLVAQKPQIGDELAAWLPARIHNRLREHGIMTIYGLHKYIDQHGASWWRKIKGFGEVKAIRLLQWLDAHEGSIGARAPAHSRPGFRAQIQKNIRAGADVTQADRLANITTGAVRRDHLGPDEAPSALDLNSQRRVTAVPVGAEGTASIVPMEQIAHFLSPQLDGSTGTFRNTTSANTLGAQNDLQAIRSWLDSYSGHTLRAYRKEVERLLLWAITERNKPISSLTRDDLLAYRAFLADPQPREKWCAPRSRLRNTSGWRPFEGPLSETAGAYAMRVIGNLLEFLASQGYTIANPARGLRAPDPKQLERQFGRRTLSNEQWDEVRLRAPETSLREKRLVLMLLILYNCGLRISEMLSAKIADIEFPRAARAESEMPPSLEVQGKRSKKRDVAIDWDIVERIYDLANALGVDHRKGYIIPKIAGRLGEALDDPNQGIDYVTAAREIKKHMERVASELRTEGKGDLASSIESASAHWLRHSHASHFLAQGAQLNQIREDLGHTSLTTTSVYLTSDREERMRAMVRVKRMIEEAQASKWNQPSR